jgi:hypothetical protein
MTNELHPIMCFRVLVIRRDNGQLENMKVLADSRKNAKIVAEMLYGEVVN